MDITQASEAELLSELLRRAQSRQPMSTLVGKANRLADLLHERAKAADHAADDAADLAAALNDAWQAAKPRTPAVEWVDGIHPAPGDARQQNGATP